MKKLLVFPLIVLLAGCTPNTDSISMNNAPAQGSTSQEETFTSAKVEQDYGKAFDNASKLQLFLYEDLSTVTFEGQGNEFASYTIKTNWLNENYVRYEQDNGGVVLAKYYRVLADGIYLINQVENETMPKTVAALENLPVLSTVFISPAEVGTTFNGWTITASHESYTTPYDAFDKVIVLEKQTENIIERQYYVAGVGAIAYEFETIDDNGETTVISSKLKSILF